MEFSHLKMKINRQEWRLCSKDMLMLNLKFSLSWVGILLKPAHRGSPRGYGVPLASMVSFELKADSSA